MLLGVNTIEHSFCPLIIVILQVQEAISYVWQGQERFYYYTGCAACLGGKVSLCSFGFLLKPLTCVAVWYKSYWAMQLTLLCFVLFFFWLEHQCTNWWKNTSWYSKWSRSEQKWTGWAHWVSPGRYFFEKSCRFNKQRHRYFSPLFWRVGLERR